MADDTQSWRVYSYGRARFGQLGIDHDVGSPTIIPGLQHLQVQAIAAGEEHSAVLDGDGVVWTFGEFVRGQLGRAGDDFRLCMTPTPVQLPGRTVQISAGQHHTVALTEEGDVYAWGAFQARDAAVFGVDAFLTGQARSWGCLQPTMITPSMLSADRESISVAPIKKIQSGFNHILMLGRNDEAYSCGAYDSGQLGRSREEEGQRRLVFGQRVEDSILFTRPNVVPGLGTVNDLFASGDASFFVVGGQLLACGNNVHCKLGIVLTFNDAAGLIRRPRLSSFPRLNGSLWKEVTTGDSHTTATTNTEDFIYEVGRIRDGGDTIIPHRIKNVTFRQVIAHGSRTYGVRLDGRISWWHHPYDQNGPRSRRFPVPHDNQKQSILVSMGKFHALVLVKDRPQQLTNSSDEIPHATRPIKKSKSWPEVGAKSTSKSGTGQQDSRIGRVKSVEAMSTMRSSDMIPIQKYKLDAPVFTNTDPKVIKDFFHIWGPEVVSMQMSIEPKDAAKILGEITALPRLWKMTKLKTLAFQTFDDQQGGPEGIVKLLEFLFIAGKGLRELELSYLRSGEIVDLQEHLIQLIATRIPMTVKDLKLYLELNESTFNNIAGSGLQLDSFELRVPSLLESGALYKFLESQAATLRSLRIWSPRGEQTGIPVKFPHLGQLVHLELSDVIVSFETNSDFAKTFPKLHCLEISRMTTETALMRILFPSGKSTAARSLKVLHMPNWRQTPLTPFVGTIAQVFPSIAELHIWLYNQTQETLEEVFIYFENLESLNITFAEVGRTLHADSLFSGISQADCGQIGGLRNFIYFRNVNLDEMERRPSLTNLTKLKKLVVKKVVMCDMVALTDFSAHFVLLEMRDLREFYVASGMVGFTPGYEKRLRDKLVLRVRGQ